MKINIDTFLANLNPITTSKGIITFNNEEQNRISQLITKIITGVSKDSKNGRTINNLLRHFLWNATAYNNNGKGNPYEIQPFWSKMAIESYLDRKYNNYNIRRSGLRHEHSIPIKLIKEKIWENPDKVKEIINTCSIAVVLTKEENEILNKKYNDSLPSTFDWNNPNVFIRYIETDISAIYNIEENEELNALIKADKVNFNKLKFILEK